MSAVDASIPQRATDTSKQFIIRFIDNSPMSRISQVTETTSDGQGQDDTCQKVGQVSVRWGKDGLLLKPCRVRQFG